MNAMMTVEEALARVIASGAPPLEEEKVALEQAYGRVLVRDLKALCAPSRRFPIPPWTATRSARPIQRRRRRH